MVSKRIKYARAHLSRRRHIAILATPLWRRVQRHDFNCLPRPFSVPRAALRARTTKRIKMMAKPKYVQRKYDPRSYEMSLRTHRESLSAEREPSKRLIDLALPKKSALIHARRYILALHPHTSMLENVNSLLRGLRHSRYQKYRIICNSLQQRVAAREAKIRRKLHRVLKKPSDWDRHMKVLARIAVPKPVHKPPRLPRKAGRLFDLGHLEHMAQPKPKPRGLDRNPFAVHRPALFYNITERMLKLAFHQNPREEPKYNIPGQVKPEALIAKTTERINELAKPATRPPGLETDLKEDAFGVVPRALKAHCSRRTKKLAQPKKRPRPRL